MIPEREKLTRSVLYIPHGGGPLPLLGDENHFELIEILKNITERLVKPSAIIVISAHWEEEQVTITSGPSPRLIYDYFGFPEKAYDIKYPASGDPGLATKIYKLFQQSGIDAKLDDQRGFDHGLFVPLKLMYPEATIPCVQLSLLKSMDPEPHIQIGRALSGLRQENILVLGSGFSFHNMRAFLTQETSEPDIKNESFESWLNETCTNTDFSKAEREYRLLNWVQAPNARYCHPREEHLLPLHVCYGMADYVAEQVFSGKILGKLSSAYLWNSS